MNNTTAVVGGIIIIVLIAAVVFMSSERIGSLFGNATSTVATSTGSGNNTPPGDTPVPGKPIPTTNSTVAPTETTAVVTGTVNPRGAITSYWYEYGTTSSLGNKTANQVVGSGYATTQTPGFITGLTKNTTYYYRLVAENQYGRVAGLQRTVKTTEGTPPPVGSIPTVKSLSAANVARTTANVRGEVTPNKAATQYWFEYGTSANLGSTTGIVSVGDGSTLLPVSAALSGLSAGTTYYYRINAQNQFGTVNGSILTFQTPGAPVATPSVTSRTPVAVEKTTATLRGFVDPNGAETSYWFEYSTNSALDAVLLKTTPQRSAGAGSNQVSVEATVTGLQTNTTYYVRVVARNSAGTSRGDKMSFKTK